MIMISQTLVPIDTGSQMCKHVPSKVKNVTVCVCVDRVTHHNNVMALIILCKCLKDTMVWARILLCV